MRLTHLAAACLVALGAACSKPQQPAQNAQAAQSATDARAQKDLVAYQQLVAANSVELAASIGRGIVTQYPGSAAATEVQKTLPNIEAQAKDISEKKRMTALWMYQSGDASSGKQHVASIYSTTPATEPERVRLLLRRHNEWGQSVYLHGDQNGFECASPCKIAIKFDDTAEQWTGEIPSGGENAIFVKDDQKFLDRIQGVKRVQFDVKRKGIGPQTLVCEIGGFDPSKWPSAF